MLGLGLTTGMGVLGDGSASVCLGAVVWTGLGLAEGTPRVCRGFVGSAGGDDGFGVESTLGERAGIGFELIGDTFRGSVGDSS